MFPQKTDWPGTYTSTHGVRVAKSAQHAGMFIISHPDGKFHNYHSIDEEVLRKYPPTSHRSKNFIAPRSIISARFRN